MSRGSTRWLRVRSRSTVSTGTEINRYEMKLLRIEEAQVNLRLLRQGRKCHGRY